jgi:hypothetical protein
LQLAVGGGGGVLESGLAAKYITAQSEVTPLRTELVTLLPAAGTYPVSVRVA